MAESVELLVGRLPLLRPQAPISRATRVSGQVNLSVSMVELPRPGCGRRRGSLCCAGAVDAAGSVGGEVFSVTSSSKSDVDYLGESTKGDLNVNREHMGAFGI